MALKTSEKLLVSKTLENLNFPERNVFCGFLKILNLDQHKTDKFGISDL